MKITRIIMIKGAVETLEFFSIQLAKTFEKKGIEVWFWDMKSPLGSREIFESFQHYENTIFLTFNFIGLSGESQFHSETATSLWEKYGIDSYCIMVDHPMYYYRQLISGIKNLNLICIDRDHQKFIEQYYPDYGRAHFLPLAGTELSDEKIPYSERDIDVIFTGNYVPIKNLMPHIEPMEEDNKEFYFDIIHELIENPDIPIEQELIGRLTKEFPQITREETLACLHSMIFIDLYVRSYFRREIICSLAEKGIKVFTVGKDWEKSGCKCLENISMTGQGDSLACLKYMCRAKISVNIMPWFKDGAHDRIFNAMLQGCVTVTDSSRYLDEIIHDGQDFVKFTLEQREAISQKVQNLLDHPDTAAAIAKKGYLLTSQHHTWEQRANTLLNNIFSD